MLICCQTSRQRAANACGSKQLLATFITGCLKNSFVPNIACHKLALTVVNLQNTLNTLLFFLFCDFANTATYVSPILPKRENWKYNCMQLYWHVVVVATAVNDHHLSLYRPFHYTLLFSMLFLSVYLSQHYCVLSSIFAVFLALHFCTSRFSVHLLTIFSHFFFASLLLLLLTAISSIQNVSHCLL